MQNRTADLLLTMETLYRLSYRGKRVYDTRGINRAASARGQWRVSVRLYQASSPDSVVKTHRADFRRLSRLTSWVAGEGFEPP